MRRRDRERARHVLAVGAWPTGAGLTGAETKTAVPHLRTLRVHVETEKPLCLVCAGRGCEPVRAPHWRTELKTGPESTHADSTRTGCFRPSAGTRAVRTDLLDNHFSAPVYLMKMDIEGHESLAIRVLAPNKQTNKQTD